MTPNIISKPVFFQLLMVHTRRLRNFLIVDCKNKPQNLLASGLIWKEVKGEK